MLASARLRDVRLTLEGVLADINRVGRVAPLNSYQELLRNRAQALRDAEEQWRAQLDALLRKLDAWRDEHGPVAWARVLCDVGMYYESAAGAFDGALNYVWALFVERVERRFGEMTDNAAARATRSLAEQEVRSYEQNAPAPAGALAPAAQRLRTVRRELELVLADLERSGFADAMESTCASARSWIEQIRDTERMLFEQLVSFRNAIDGFPGDRGIHSWGKLMVLAGLWFESSESPVLFYAWALFIERIERMRRNAGASAAACVVRELVDEELAVLGDRSAEAAAETSFASAMCDPDADQRSLYEES